LLLLKALLEGSDVSWGKKRKAEFKGLSGDARNLASDLEFVMRCPSCAYENNDGPKFCSQCATPLRQEYACSACGFVNAPGSRFCSDCAQPLTATTSGAVPTRTPTPAPALPVSFAGGRYVVRGFLGEGGRKRVYLAHDTKLDRDVAFAVIKTEGLDPDGVERVDREAQAVGRLGRPGHLTCKTMST
jgi:eukaryotic-like serine/threonine-protein kinase